MKIQHIGRVVLVVLAILATALTATAVARRDDKVDVKPRPVVLFAGDSFTAGAMLRSSAESYAQLVGLQADWDLHVDAQGGTGFIADGHGTGNGDTSRMVDRLEADKRANPSVDLLIVDAGRNDLGLPPEQISAAIDEYLKRARELWPNAAIVEILPTPINPTPYGDYSAIRDMAAADVHAVGGTLIDPYADGWYDDIDPQSLLQDDLVHPNAAGHAHLAEHLRDSLQKIGVMAR